MNQSEHNPQYACLLVDLDSILDTRLGTIARFGKEVYVKALQNGYYTRRSDHFFGVDNEKYRELYSERDIVTLSYSMMTHVVSLLKDFVTRVNVTSATSPIKKIPRIDINTYPYVIPDEVMNTIIKAIHVHIADKVNIGHVHYSFKDMHYDLIKFTYDHLDMYDLSHWLDAQAEDWERRNRGMPEVTVFFPILHRGKNVSEVPEDISMMADEFNMLISPIINPMQIPIQFFCSVLDPGIIKPASGADAPDAVKE